MICALQPQKGNDQVYDDIARMAVFIEQARLDEFGQEAGQSDHSFHGHYMEIENNIYHLLCALQLAMDRQGQEVSQDVTADIMTLSFRDISDRARRRERDFIIARDSCDVLHHASNHFVRMADLLSSPSEETNRLR